MPKDYDYAPVRWREDIIEYRARRNAKWVAGIFIVSILLAVLTVLYVLDPTKQAPANSQIEQLSIADPVVVDIDPTQLQCQLTIDDVDLCIDATTLTFDPMTESAAIIGWVDLLASNGEDPLVILARAGEWGCVELARELDQPLINVAMQTEADNDLPPGTVYVLYRQGNGQLCATPAPVLEGSTT